MTAAGSDRRLEEARRLLRVNDARGLVTLLGDLEKADLIAEPELGFLLATGLRRVGESARAFEIVGDISPACDRRGRDQLWRSRLNLEAALRLERGEAAEAETAWQTLTEDATFADDAAMLARAHNNLGIICTLQGRWEEALANYGRALAANHRLGDRRGLAQAHQNIAICYREVGFMRQADAHFRSAIDDALATASEDVAGRAEEERALLMLLQRDPRMARAAAERSLERLRRIGDTAGEGEALRVLGMIAIAESRPAEAERLLRQALQKAVSSRAALLEAETLDALTALAPESRTDHDERARHIFAAFGAEAWGEHVRRRVEGLVRGAPPGSSR